MCTSRDIIRAMYGNIRRVAVQTKNRAYLIHILLVKDQGRAPPSTNTDHPQVWGTRMSIDSMADHAHVPDLH